MLFFKWIFIQIHKICNPLLSSKLQRHNIILQNISIKIVTINALLSSTWRSAWVSYISIELLTPFLLFHLWISERQRGGHVEAETHLPVQGPGILYSVQEQIMLAWKIGLKTHNSPSMKINFFSKLLGWLYTLSK